MKMPYYEKENVSKKSLKNLQVEMAQNFPPDPFECVKKVKNRSLKLRIADDMGLLNKRTLL